MANINRDYIVRVDVRTGKVTTPKIKFKNVDKSTSNIYVQLVIKDTPYKLPVLVEKVEDLAVSATIIKPNKAYKTVHAVLVDTTGGRLFELNLPDDCINLSGTCKVELTITGSVNGDIEQTTADVFTYTVEKSLQNELDPSIQDSEDLPILKQLIEDMESVGGYKPKVDVNGTIIDSVQGVVKIPDYDTKSVTQAAIKELEDARVDTDGTTHIKLGDRLNKVDSQIKEKATNQELEVERQRINLLTKIENGQTDGNTELLDIRIDSDGYVYETAGESVRKQIDKCVKYSEGKNIFNKNSTDKIEGYYINKANGYKNISDYYVAYILKINPGSVISINKNTGIHVCFATEYSDIVNMSTNTIINGFISGTSGGSNIQVPTNAKYMTISTNISAIDTLQIEYGQSSTYFEEYELHILEIDATSKDLNDFKQANQDKLNIIDVITNIVNYDTAEDGYFYNGFNSTSSTVDKQAATNYKAWQPVTVQKGVTYSFYGSISMNFSGIVDNAGNKIDKLGNIVTGNTFSVDNDCLLYITTTGTSENVMVINDDKDPNVFIPFGEKLIKINDRVMENKVEIVVGEGQEYTTLKDAIEYATQYSNSKIFVNDGIYDLVSEFGDEVNNSVGLVLKNNVHIIFSSNSKVTFNYEGDSSNVHTLFSPFNSGEGGFIIENLTLEAKNCKYCVHDERGNTLDNYRNIYRNCKFSLDNTNNPDWKNPQNIGIGFGTNGYIEIDGCVFNSWVSFHNNNGTQTEYESKLVVKNCYFEKGAVMGGSTGSGTDKSIVQVFNNSFYLQHQITEGQNIKAYIYNNEVRS